MVSIRHILVPIDFSDCSRQAFAYAAELARAFTAKLTALHVYPYYVPSSDWALGAGELPWTDTLENVEAELRRFVTPAGSDAPLAQAIVCTGETVPEILDHARGVDVIVMGTHGRRGVARWAVGSVADGVVRKAPCPVLAIPPHSRRATIARVLCGVDLGATSADTLTYAGAVAEVTGAPLQVLHVVDLASAYEPWMLNGEDEERIRRSITESAEKRAGALAFEHVPPRVPVDVRAVIGQPRRELERVAGEGADLAVVGSHSTGALHRFFFGSTAERLLRGDVCPVLFVRPLRGADRRTAAEDPSHAVVS
jgi:nucleotide-binding universal stress UspA family protein